MIFFQCRMLYCKVGNYLSNVYKNRYKYCLCQMFLYKCSAAGKVENIDTEPIFIKQF